jgi:hypothetical protein
MTSYRVENYRPTNFYFQRGVNINVVGQAGAGIMGKEGYVWVLTSLEEVTYFHPRLGWEKPRSLLHTHFEVIV